LTNGNQFAIGDLSRFLQMAYKNIAPDNRVDIIGTDVIIPTRCAKSVPFRKDVFQGDGKTPQLIGTRLFSMAGLDHANRAS
jgi:hypothetical protein